MCLKWILSSFDGLKSTQKQLKILILSDPENLEFMETSMADNGGVAQIKSLQYSHAEKINAAAYKIMEEFF